MALARTLDFSARLLIIVSLFTSTALAEERGKALFRQCSSCHGAEAQGNAELGAPSIAGLPEWYIAAQLAKFESGVRGSHPSDDPGNRMRPMARTLRDDDAKLVAAHVSGLKPVAPPSTLGGNAEKGKAYFAVCMACHGPTGDGNQALNAPSLKNTSDWYLVRQLMNFKNKVRGADAAKDPNGSIMAGQAATLPDEQAMKDVITYVQSLR